MGDWVEFRSYAQYNVIDRIRLFYLCLSLGCSLILFFIDTNTRSSLDQDILVQPPRDDGNLPRPSLVNPPSVSISNKSGEPVAPVQDKLLLTERMKGKDQVDQNAVFVVRFGFISPRKFANANFLLGVQGGLAKDKVNERSLRDRFGAYGTVVSFDLMVLANSGRVVHHPLCYSLC